MAAGEQPVGKQPEQRSVGVRHYGVDCVEKRSRLGIAEHQNACHKHGANAKVRAATKLLVIRPSADVDAKAGGERSKCRIGAAERRSHYAEREQDLCPQAKLAGGGEHGQQGVGFFGQRDVEVGCEHGQQHAKRKEQQVHRHKCQAIAAHVFLRFAQSAACEILLHHVLVESGHHHNNEGAANELFPEVLRRHPVVENKNAAVRMP